MRREVVLDTLSVLLITYAAIVFAYGTTLINENQQYAMFCVIGEGLLLLGLVLGGIVHGYMLRNKVGGEVIYYGSVGVALVAIAQVPVVLVGLSIYPLSVGAVGRVLFLTAQAVAEELFFANYIYAYLARTARMIHANVATATIFMVFHWAVYAQHPVVLLVVFMSRLALNWTYTKGGLGASMLSHFIVNLVAGM